MVDEPAAAAGAGETRGCETSAGVVDVEDTGFPKPSPARDPKVTPADGPAAAEAAAEAAADDAGVEAAVDGTAIDAGAEDCAGATVAADEHAPTRTTTMAATTAATPIFGCFMDSVLPSYFVKVPVRPAPAGPPQQVSRASGHPSFLST